MLTAFGVIILAYFLGAIPTGYWVARAVKGIDIRQHGSGSTGATNVLRCVGKVPGAFVFIADIGKGYLAVWLAIYLESLGLMSGVPFPELELIPMVVALVTLFGHSRSIFLKFQGGKSAATALGNAIAMNLVAAGMSFGLWLVVLGATRFVSLASILAVCSSSIFMAINHAPVGYIAYCALGAVYVVYRHKPNIARMLAGTEPRLGEKSKGSAAEKVQGSYE